MVGVEFRAFLKLSSVSSVSHIVLCRYVHLFIWREFVDQFVYAQSSFTVENELALDVPENRERTISTWYNWNFLFTFS